MNTYRNGRIRQTDTRPHARVRLESDELIQDTEVPDTGRFETETFETEPFETEIPEEPEEMLCDEPAAEETDGSVGYAAEETAVTPRTSSRPPRRSERKRPPEEDAFAEEAQQLATNRTVLLTCTLAAMMSPFAAFLLWAEKNSRAIRHNSVQSVALAVIHLLTAAVCFGAMALAGSVPLVGFVVTLCGWLLYFGVLVWTVSVRLRLMRRAWLGLRYEIPLLGGWLERFV